MNASNESRLDNNIKRVAAGALITLSNVSTNTRQHYYISDNPNTPFGLQAHGSVTVLSTNDQLAQALIGKMKGDKIFFRHDLLIEFIEWPHTT